MASTIQTAGSILGAVWFLAIAVLAVISFVKNRRRGKQRDNEVGGIILSEGPTPGDWGDGTSAGD